MERKIRSNRATFAPMRSVQSWAQGPWSPAATSTKRLTTQQQQRAKEQIEAATARRKETVILRSCYASLVYRMNGSLFLSFALRG